ncbi:MAG: hypothetical protein EA341_06250 [Mongoliibacter sp.]|uniref:hypothetical protein n=1 Tax=Mongoliibacter sp. TaxID=2022438 RepID=UPI0012F0ADB7|nr:hypothetical protein [Mongoliibacter sp.]TVP50971.1 MAG: hypothetical protein EA341_06250 [Mongoliibacter sp.]
MKKLIFVLLFSGCLFHDKLLAQTQWEIKAFAGASDAAFLGSYLVGGPNVNVDRFQEFGVRLSWKGDSKWGMETGLSYAKAILSLSSMWIPTGNPPPRPSSSVIVIKEPFDYISLPAIVTFEVTSFLTIQAGPLVGVQLSEYSDWLRQSGVGYLIGLNLHHYIDRWGIFLQPNFKQHSVIGIHQSSMRLTEFGLQFGVGYKL